MNEKRGGRHLDPETLEQAKSRIVKLLTDCGNSVSESSSGDEITDAITPTINILLDYKQATLRELSGFHPSGLAELLSRDH